MTIFRLPIEHARRVFVDCLLAEMYPPEVPYEFDVRELFDWLHDHREAVQQMRGLAGEPSVRTVFITSDESAFGEMNAAYAWQRQLDFQAYAREHQGPPGLEPHELADLVFGLGPLAELPLAVGWILLPEGASHAG